VFSLRERTLALIFSCIDSTELEIVDATAGPLPLRPSVCLSAPVEYPPEDDCTVDAIFYDANPSIGDALKQKLDFSDCEAEGETGAQATQASSVIEVEISVAQKAKEKKENK